MGFHRCRGQPDRADAADRPVGEGGRAVRAGARHDVDLHGQPGDAPDRPVHVASWHHRVRPGDRARCLREHLPRRAPPRRLLDGVRRQVRRRHAAARRTSTSSARTRGRTGWPGPPASAFTSPKRTPATRSTSCGRRPKDKPFSLTVGFFAAHAEDNAPEQYLPQDWSARLYEGVTIPPPLRGDPRIPGGAAAIPVERRQRGPGPVSLAIRYARELSGLHDPILPAHHRSRRGGRTHRRRAEGAGRLRQHAHRVHRRQRLLPGRSRPRRQVVPVRGVGARAAHRARPAAAGRTARPDARPVRAQPRCRADARRRRRAFHPHGDAGPGSESALPGDAGTGVARRVLLRAPDRPGQGPHSLVAGRRSQGTGSTSSGRSSTTGSSSI